MQAIHVRQHLLMTGKIWTPSANQGQLSDSHSCTEHSLCWVWEQMLWRRPLGVYGPKEKKSKWADSGSMWVQGFGRGKPGAQECQPTPAPHCIDSRIPAWAQEEKSELLLKRWHCLGLTRGPHLFPQLPLPHMCGYTMSCQVHRKSRTLSSRGYIAFKLYLFSGSLWTWELMERLKSEDMVRGRRPTSLATMGQLFHLSIVSSLQKRACKILYSFNLCSHHI